MAWMNKEGLEMIKLHKRLSGIKGLIRGVDYGRYLELSRVIHNLGRLNNMDVMDIGTGPYPFYIIWLLLRGAKVIALDASEDVLEVEKFFMGHRDFNHYHIGGKLEVRIEDARNLSFPDNSFDRITLISTIEHIRGNDDILIMQEIGRVLKPNGLAVLSFPIADKLTEEYVIVPYREAYKYKEKEITVPYSKRYEDDTIGYLVRRYDLNRIENNLVRPSGLWVKGIEYYGEVHVQFWKFWRNLPFKMQRKIGFIQPIATTLFFKRINMDEIKRIKDQGICILTLCKR